MFVYVCGQWLLSLVLFEIIRCILSLPLPPSLSLSIDGNMEAESNYSYSNVCIIIIVIIIIIFLFLFFFFSPENVSRLFDLVKVKDKKYLTAFYYALTDTLVANDLDQATRIGLQVLLL